MAWRAGSVLRVTVIAKASFGFASDAAMPRVEPQAVLRAEVHHGNNFAKSVRFTPDLVPYLNRAEVLFTGHAYPNVGGSAGSPGHGTARLGIFDGSRPLLDKALRIQVASAERNERVPLVYERTFAGPDNPYGAGGKLAIAGGPDVVATDGSRQPVSLAPMPAWSPARKRRLGALAPETLKGAIMEIPQGFDWAYFQAAPPDQWSDFLRGGEWIVMEGLDPELARSRMRLPDARGLARVYGLPGGSEEGVPLALVADVLRIDGDERTCTLTFRASFPVANEAALASLRVVAGVESADEPIAWPTSPSSRASSAVAAAPVETPFREINLEATAQLESASPEPSTPSFESTFSMGADSVQTASQRSAMPFRKDTVAETNVPRVDAITPTPGSVRPPPVPVRKPHPLAGGTLDGIERGAASLPFAKDAPAPAASQTPSGPAAKPTLLSSALGKSTTLGAAASASSQAPSPPPVVVRKPHPLAGGTLDGVLPTSASEAPLPFPSTGNPEGTSPKPLQGSAISNLEGGPPRPLPGSSVGSSEESVPRPVEGSSIEHPEERSTPARPAVPTSRFFHEIGHTVEHVPVEVVESALELPRRLGNSVPFVFEGEGHRIGPVTGATMAWQLTPPRDSLTIILKASFDLVADGAATLRPRAELPRGEVFKENDRHRSLVQASDFTQYKPRVDVVLRGTAYACHGTPSGAPATVDVRFRFGSAHAASAPGGAGGSAGFERTIRVFGERLWQRGLKGLRPSDPAPFETLAVDYDAAFGGPGYAANPAGRGHGLKGDPVGTPLPSLEDPASLIASPSDTPAPASFGPIPVTWKERWSKLGTYDDAAYVQERAPYFAADMDLTALQAAPSAQQVTSVQGDELYEIAGMHPVMPVFRGSLPGRRIRCFAQHTTATGAAFKEVAVRIDTVSFDMDARRLDLVWRGVMEVSDDDSPELALLFAFVEDMSEHATLAEAQARFARALRAKTEQRKAPARPEPPGRAAEHEEAKRAADETAAAHRAADRETERKWAEERARIEERLAASGVPRAKIDAVFNPPASATGAPRATKSGGVPDEAIEALRRAGVSEIDIAAAVASAAPPPERPAPPPARATGTPDPALRERVERLLASGEPLENLELAGADLSGMDLEGRSLVGCNLRGAKLARSIFRGANLTRARLAAADLTEAVLDGANLTQADLAGATLERARFVGAMLSQVDMSEAHGEHADFQRARGQRARFSKGQWAGAQFQESELPIADFSGALLDDASFDRAALADVRLMGARGTHASFAGTRMAGARANDAAFLECVFRGADAPKSIWMNATIDGSDFSGARLHGAMMVRATCRGTNLSGVDLSEARLDRAELTGTLLVKTNLKSASLQHARADNADLRGANLYSCNTLRAAFPGAKLDGAITAKSGPWAKGAGRA